MSLLAVFTHREGVSSVLLVTEEDFDTCNTRSPVQRLEAAGGGGSGGSNSVFRFDRSGPFFFISSDVDRCQKGQKLYIIVMAPRPPVPVPVPVAPAPGPSQWTASPPASPVAPPPLWAPAPEYANAPGMSPLGGHKGTSLSSTLEAPPPTAGASRSVDNAFVGSAVGVVVGAMVLCAML